MRWRRQETLSVAERPLIVAAAAFAAGIGATWAAGSPFPAVWAAAACMAGGLFLPRGLRWRRLPLIAGALIALGALRAGIELSACDDEGRLPPIGSYIDADLTVAGSPTQRPTSYTCEVVLNSARGPDRGYAVSGGRWFCTLRSTPFTAPPAYGAHLSVHGRVDDIAGNRNPGGPDFAAYARRHGVSRRLVSRHPSDWSVLPGCRVTDLLRRAPDAARAVLARVLRSLIPEPRASLVISAVLGDRSVLPSSICDDFAATGTTHLLAASGANVLLVWLASAWVLRLVRVPRRGALALGGAAIWFYAGMAGGQPSVIRAAVMLTVWLGAELLDREGDMGCTLAAAALACLAVDPADLMDAGFQLSFLVVAALAMSPRGKQDRVRGGAHSRRHLWRAARVHEIGYWFRATVVASVVAAPLLAQHFNQVSLVAIPANAAVTVAVVLLMWIAPCAAVLGAVAPAIARPAADLVLSPLAGFVLWAERCLARSPAAAVNVPSPGWPATILACCSMFVILALMRPRERSAEDRRRASRCAAVSATLAVLAAVLAGAAWRAPDGLGVTVLDVGQGDAIAIHVPGGGYWMVDAGPSWEDDDAGRRVVLPYLRSMGVNRLTGLVVTHGDTDHAGGARTLLQRLPVGTLCCARPVQSDPGVAALLPSAAAAGTHVVELAEGDSITVAPDVRLDVLGPGPPSPRDSANDRSLVLRLVAGDTAIVLAGDATARSERRVLSRNSDVRSAVLKVSHHGSPSASSEEFLRAVQPDLAVISVGRRNVFGHPAPDVLERLRGCGARIVRTDREGAVTLRSDGRRWLYSTFADSAER